MTSTEASATGSQKKWVLWLGRVLSVLPALLFVLSGVMKISHNPKMVEGLVGKAHLPEGALTPIGIVEILCAVIYLVPPTAVLGAVLFSAYAGGIIVVHLHEGQSILLPIILSGVLWLGLYLREPRLRALLPMRKATA
jgi:hypothetical protein